MLQQQTRSKNITRYNYKRRRLKQMKKKKNLVTRNPQVDGVAVTASQRCFSGYGAPGGSIRLVQITWDMSLDVQIH